MRRSPAESVRDRGEDGGSTPHFPVPEHFSDEEIEAIWTTSRLLAHQPVRGTWSELRFSATAADLRTLGISDIGSNSVPFVSEVDLVVHIAGHEMPVGWVRQTLSSARVQSSPDLSDSTEPDRECEVVFVPSDDDTKTWFLVDEAPAAPDRAAS
jgi:hypothetical protein